ncbi:MAG: DUF2336 domain-containing protein [Micavibrio sp.]
MDLRLFEKSPDVAPILVRLYDNHRLYSLAKDETPLARAELTSAVVELLEKDLGPRERELISDVLISLMRQAESDLRQALSERLAVIDSVPLRVALHIANDEISVATPMLKTSPVLSDLDLLYIIKGKGAEYWRAIADRAHLSDGVMNVLADTREAGTVLTLARNDKIRLTRRTIDVISDMAETSEDLARPLLMRTDLPESIARNLYQHVGKELRQYIRDYFGVQDAAVNDALDDILVEFAEGDEKQFMPTAQMIDAANAMAAKGRISLQSVMETLQRGQYASFIALFSKYSGLSARTVHDVLSESGGKTLAVACKALNLTKGDLSRIYMMTQRLRSEDRIVDHNELLKALSAYDRVTVDQAQNLIGMKK